MTGERIGASGVGEEWSARVFEQPLLLSSRAVVADVGVIVSSR